MMTSLPVVAERSPMGTPITGWLKASEQLLHIFFHGLKLNAVLVLRGRFDSMYILITLPSALLKKSPSCWLLWSATVPPLCRYGADSRLWLAALTASYVSRSTPSFFFSSSICFTFCFLT